MKMQQVDVLKRRGATLTYFRPAGADRKPATTHKPGSLKAFAAKEK